MEKKTIVLNSELEFRRFVNFNSEKITQLLVFEDYSDKTIFFYCFTNDGIILSTKESSKSHFPTFKKFYTKLAKNLNLYIFPGSTQLITIKL